MTQQYLLEIGMEEIPARFLVDLSVQLKERMENFLNDNRLLFEDVRSFATPRRLAVIVDGLASKQTDLEEKVKGPALRIAKDKDGEWTKAAQGFVRGQKVAVEDIIIDTIKDEEYIFVNKFIEGKKVESVLAHVNSVIEDMTFPVSMTWGNYHTAFIRPIHWIVSLLDQEMIPFSFINIDAGKVSEGHRFLGEKVTIESPASYEEQLEEEFVVANFNKRRNIIKKQIQDIAVSNNWQVPIDAELLEEVTALVEWPTAFYGEFEEKYLTIPRMILVTAMRDHQRYFYAEDVNTGKLKPIFISVRNGDSNHIDNVIKGNKKVLKARLEDALFFYEDDLTHSIEEFVAKLEHVNEHFKLGSLADKQRRVEAIIPLISEQIKEPDFDTKDIESAQTAAQIYKFDLMTGIIGEFDELQGKMGEWYARYYGQEEGVAQAIGTQYLPSSSGGQLPETQAGSLLALADKLDTLINYFNVGLIPTGSNDPYALRRQAMGIVEIILNQNWNINLEEVIKQLVDQLDEVNEETLVSKVANFIKARIEPILNTKNVDYDISQAVFQSSHLNIVYIVSSAEHLNSFKDEKPEHYRQMVEALIRVVNLGVKGEGNASLDHSLIQTESEQTLLKQIDQLTLNIENPKEQLQQFIDLIHPIEDYFEMNMVNAEEEHIKQNRYATMRALTDYIFVMMDPRELISKF